MALRPGQPILTLDAADVTLGGTPVLRQVSFGLAAGDRIALLGANGSGKSTLLRLVRGDQWLDPGSAGQRAYHVPEDPQRSPMGARERMALVGPEDQDAYARRELDLPVEAVIRSGLDAALYPVERPTPARAARVRAAARALGVTRLLDRSVLSLSRGEARRVLVARALAPRPDVLLLDEVCDGLDALARRELLARLGALDRRVAVVTATHRAEELFPGVERAVLLERGRVVATGRPREVVRRWRASFLERDHDPDLDLDRDRDRERDHERDLFRLEGATVLVEGRPVLDRIDWAVRAGEPWAVTGPNGSGKSTLLRLLAGEEQPARGTVRRLDLGLRADVGDLRGRVGQVSPELQARHRFDAAGAEVVLSGFQGSIGLSRRPTGEERRRAAEVLAELGLSHLARRRSLTCSYGELRLLLLARALAPRPEALLLDEPFAGLDPRGRAALVAAVDRLARAGTGLVLVTHHEDEVPGAVRRRARLEGGRLRVTR